MLHELFGWELKIWCTICVSFFSWLFLSSGFCVRITSYHHTRKINDYNTPRICVFSGESQSEILMHACMRFPRKNRMLFKQQIHVKTYVLNLSQFFGMYVVCVFQLKLGFVLEHESRSSSLDFLKGLNPGNIFIWEHGLIG